MTTTPTHDDLCIQLMFPEENRVPADICRECDLIAQVERRTLARLRGVA
jgi:hypothetical protein